MTDAESRRRIEVPATALTRFCIEVLRALKVPEDGARQVADALVAADLEDLESHGVMLLPLYVDHLSAGSVSPTATGKIISDMGTAIVIDAGNGLGQVIAERACGLAVERAKAQGIAAVTVREAFHFGAAGRWARKMAEAGCVGIAMSNTRPLMPAPGGAERVVGNNPLAIAVPSAGKPILVDLAMSAVAMGKIRLAAAAGEPIPEGWASDTEGRPTTDPAAAIAGMLLPAAGAKGFGLALMVDLLAGGLSSGAIGDAVRPLYGKPPAPYRCAQLFFALDVTAFRPLADFTAATSARAERIRGSRAAPGAPPVHVPGDRGPQARARNAGRCRIAASAVGELSAIGKRLSIALPAEFIS